MPEYLVRSKTYESNDRTFGNDFLIKKEKIDPQNPTPVQISVSCELNQFKEDQSIYFTLMVNPGNFEENSVARPCNLIFNQFDRFVAYEIQQPNSVFQLIKEKLEIMFRNTQFIQDQNKFTSETLFSKKKDAEQKKQVINTYVRVSLSEMISKLGLSSKLEYQLKENYQKYTALQPKNYNYEEIVKALYTQVTSDYQTPQAVKNKINLLLFEFNWPYESVVKHIKTTYDLVDAVSSDLYRYFAGEDKNQVMELLTQIDRHPPSMEKLEAAFLRTYPEEEGLKEWLIKMMPDHKKLWLSYLPKTQKEALDLDYDELAKVILQSYNEYIQAKNNIKSSAKIKNRLDAYEEVEKLKKFNQVREKGRNAIFQQLAKLSLNAASVKHLLNTEYFIEKDLHQYLFEMGLDQELNYLLPSVDQVSWVDVEYVEDVRYSKEDILQRGKDFRATSPIGNANGELIRYENTGEYAYIVANRDNFSGIEKRFHVKKEDLEIANYWNGFDEEGRYLIGEDKHWLQEGDVITLPNYYSPLNGEIFYKYDRNQESGIRVQKRQGEFQKVPLTCVSYGDLKNQFLEILEQYDDNTKTFSLKFDVALQLNAQLTAFFYIGVEIGGNIEMGSGDTRSFDVMSQCFINGSAGAGNKQIANAGVNAGRKESMNPSMFNSLNGSYTSGKHFLAFFERSIYSYMKSNEWEEELDAIGLGDAYWKVEKDREDGVWKELAKGYTQKVRVGYFGEVEAGINKFASIKGGREYKYAESYSMKKVKTMEDLLIKDDELNIDKKARQEDEIITDYAELKLGNSIILRTSFKDVYFSTNNNNLGEYLNISLTIPNCDAKKNIDDFKEILNGIKNFKVDYKKYLDKKSEAKEVVKEKTVLKEQLEKEKAPRRVRRKEAVNKLNKAKRRIEQSANARRKMRTEVKAKFKELVITKGKFKPTKEGSIDQYGRMECNFQKIGDQYILTHFKVVTGGKMEGEKGVKNGITSVKGTISATKEFEVFEYVGTDTINYTSLVYNSIFKEGIKTLDAEEKKVFDTFMNEAVREVKNKNLAATFSLFSQDSIKKITSFSTSVIAHFKQDKLQGKRLEDVYQGYWLSDKKVFQSVMSTIKRDISGQINHQSEFSTTGYSKEQLIIFECIKSHLFQEIDTLTHATTLSISKLFKTYGGDKDPRFEAVKAKILGETTAHKQWTKFKDTRGVISTTLFGKGAQMQEVATNFAVKVKKAIESYATKDKMKNYPEKAQWEECPIQDISPAQAQLYLGDIVDVVLFMQLPESQRKSKIKEVKGSDFLKNILLYKNIKANKTLLADFEEDILFPFMLENIIYGKQVYN